MKTPILGSAYTARSVNAVDSRMVNLYPEIIPEGGKEPAFLQRTPGLKFLQTVGTGPIRGLWSHQTRTPDYYIASGNQLFKVVNPGDTPTLLGSIGGTGPVTFADNGTQIFISCNGPSYVYNESTGVFAQVTDPDFPGAGMVAYLDGYFVTNDPGTQTIRVSNLLDGTKFDPLDFATAEGSPDGIVSIIADHRELWIFGTETTEVWYNQAAGAGFPLARIQGAFNEVGCAASYSVAKMDNQVYWLGQDARGRGMVYRAAGYVGQRISTHAVEWQIQQYANIADAVAYTYQKDGHSFYVLNFPSADATWVYDASTQAWHERAGFLNGQFTRHRGGCSCFHAGRVLVGDFENGNIYILDDATYDDNGTPQRWLRSWRALPSGQNSFHRTAHHSLQVDMESGVGLVSGQGSDPKVVLRWSDDGGHTWSNEHWASLGKAGEYGKRVIWRRLGMTTKLRDRVYEVSGTDPVKIAIMGAELGVTPTNA